MQENQKANGTSLKNLLKQENLKSTKSTTTLQKKDIQKPVKASNGLKTLLRSDEPVIEPIKPPVTAIQPQNKSIPIVNHISQDKTIERPKKVSIPEDKKIEEPVSKKMVSLTKEHVKKTAYLRFPFRKKAPNVLSDFEESIKRICHCPVKHTQDYIPVKNIDQGIIKTTDGRYIKIIEALPINYYAKSLSKKENITNQFAKLFNGTNYSIQLKITIDKTNPVNILKNAERNRKESDSEDFRYICNDHIKHIRNIAQNSTTKRFFIIITYEGNTDGFKSKNLEDIYSSMYNKTVSVIRILSSCGNKVIYYENAAEETMHQREILYYYFNRKTSVNQTLEERIMQVISDFNNYNTVHGTHRKYTEADFLAPLCFRTNRKDCIYMDGQYYSYLTLTDNSYSMEMVTGWLDGYKYAEKMDVDVFIRHINESAVNFGVGQVNKFQSAGALNAKNGRSLSNISSKAQNSAYVMNCLDHKDEKLFNLVTILTIRADTVQELKTYRDDIVTALKTNHIFVEESYQNCLDYFYMTMPLLDIYDSVFLTNGRNFLTSSLGTLYMMTAYELYDPTGYPLGINSENDSVVSINNFNRQYFKNGHMSIYGTSGSGKSYTEEVIGQRANTMLNARTWYIIPSKGFEYEKGCKEIGGSYITIAPMAKDCINYMEIFDETAISEDLLDEEDKQQIGTYSVCLLSQKITQLITFIQFLLGDTKLTIKERAKLNTYLTELYGKFGITEKNSSIYTDSTKSKKKDMPIISDLYETLQNDPDMENICFALQPFISGTWTNMNGQTNVNMSGFNTVFDIDEMKINDKDIFNALFYMLTMFVYGIVKGSQSIYDIVVLDEIWKLLDNPDAAAQLKEMIKLLRGYYGAVILATQDIDDCLNSKEGAAIMGNTGIKLFLKLEDNEAKKVRDVLSVSDADIEQIIGFETGTGMLFANGEKFVVDIIPSDNEDRLYSQKRRFEQRKDIAM